MNVSDVYLVVYFVRAPVCFVFFLYELAVYIRESRKKDVPDKKNKYV